MKKRIIQAAESWIGLKESDKSFKPIIEAYNSYLPHPRGVTATTKTAWCAIFISALSIKCHATNIIPVEMSCTEHLKLFKKMGVQVKDTKNDKIAIGDIVYYDWNGDKFLDHVGIVEKINGNKITVIEGNYSDSVKRRTLSTNSNVIRCFVTPKYYDITSIAKSVIRGDYGNGATRKTKLTAAGYNYDVIQQEVNNLLKKRKT